MICTDGEMRRPNAVVKAEILKSRLMPMPDEVKRVLLENTSETADLGAAVIFTCTEAQWCAITEVLEFWRLDR